MKYCEMCDAWHKKGTVCPDCGDKLQKSPPCLACDGDGFDARYVDSCLQCHGSGKKRPPVEAK